MTTELLKPVIENEQRNEDLVTQSDRQPLEEDRTPEQRTRLLEALTEMMKRRRNE